MDQPSKWAMSSLADVCQLITDGTHHSPPNAETGDFMYVTAKNVKPWGLDISDITFVDKARHKEIYSRCPAKKGDVLYIKDGVTAGLAAVNHLDNQFSMLSSVALLRPDSEVLNSEFLKHWLNSPLTFSRMTGGMTGSAIRRIILKQIRIAEISLPPLNEQRRIAAKLDSALAAVDACRQRLDGVEALLKRFRQAVLAAATSGELTREWREEYELELELWSMRRLPELGEFGRGKSRHRPRNDPRLYGGPYPFIQTGDIAQSNGIITEHEQEYSDFGLAQSRIWPSKTVCITIAANIANTAILSYPACFPDSVVGLVVDQSKALPEFAMWMVDSIRDRLQLLAPATAQKNINLNILGEIQFLLPPVEEQVEIVRRAQQLFSLADNLEARLTSARKIVERLTPALLAKAFRGELVPQDPNDEPASVLLSRIRAARQAEAAASGPSRRGRRQAAANPEPSLFDAAPVPPDRLSNLLRECGALSERALLAASELDPAGFRAQLALERELGAIQATLEDGQVLLEAVG